MISTRLDFSVAKDYFLSNSDRRNAIGLVGSDPGYYCAVQYPLPKNQYIGDELCRDHFHYIDNYYINNTFLRVSFSFAIYSLIA